MDYDSIIAAFPMLKDYPRAAIEHWIAMAPHAITEHRFGANRGRAMPIYVAHATVHSNAPIVGDPMSPHKVRREVPAHSAPPPVPAGRAMNKARRARKAAMVWGETTHGLRLMGLAKY